MVLWNRVQKIAYIFGLVLSSEVRCSLLLTTNYRLQTRVSVLYLSHPPVCSNLVLHRTIESWFQVHCIHKLACIVLSQNCLCCNEFKLISCRLCMNILENRVYIRSAVFESYKQKELGQSVTLYRFLTKDCRGTLASLFGGLTPRTFSVSL